MRKLALVTLLVAVAAVGLPGCDFHQGESISSQFGSDRFSAGGMVNLTEPVEGDAILAGGQVQIASEVRGDLVVAGGEVSVGGRVGDDLYAAGGEVGIDAIVAGNARVAGGQLKVGPATIIEGGASLSGGRVDFDGAAGSYLQVTGGRVRLNGTVGGDAVVRAGELDLGPTTRIDGKLVYRGPKAPVVPPGASITGGVEFHEDSGHRFMDGDARVVLDAGRGVGTLLWFIGVFAVAVLFAALFPAFSTRAAAFIGRDPWASLGVGLAVLVCVPFLAVMLLITIIGIPLALLLVPIYLLLLFLGWVTAALFLGQKFLELARRGAPPAGLGTRVLALLAALVVLWLLRRIPFAGPLVALVALCAGIGALVSQLWTHRERPAGAGA